MRHTVGLGMLLVVILAPGPAPVPASTGAQCITFDKPDELFARSDAVFEGTVLKAEATGARGAHAVVEIATFRVDRSWKGEHVKEVRVGTDRPFERETRYLVFAAGTPLSTSTLCRWAEPVDRAKAKLDWLAKRSSSPDIEPVAGGVGTSSANP